MKGQQETSNTTYFEKQGYFSMKCGLHAVNNLLGSQAYSKEQFNSICKQLSAMTNQSYQIPFVGGDYDVSVLIKALNDKGFQVQWHDARNQFKKQSFGPSQLQTLQGFLVNIKMPQKFYHKFLRLSGRHWISIKISSSNNSDSTVKLDSSLQVAISLSQDSLFQYLEDERKKGAQILKVSKKQSKN